RAAELGLAPELAAQVAQRQPLRVLVDGRLRVPLDRRLFHEPGPVLVVCADAMGREAEYQRPQLELLALPGQNARSEEHTSELQSRENLVCRLLLEKKKHK